jgi:endopolyphosphatase
VPNFFPTLRVIEYNITGLDKTATWAKAQSSDLVPQFDWLDERHERIVDEEKDVFKAEDGEESTSKKNKKGKKHKKKPTNPDLIVPSPPSKRSPPGPAYSPQTLTMLGYTQYFANLTFLNNDHYDLPDEIDTDKWHEGKHKGKHPNTKPQPKPFQFQVEYDTFTDPIYKLKDLTVRSYIKLAHRIGQYKPEKGDQIHDATVDSVADDDENDENDNKQIGMKKKHEKKKHHKQQEKNKVWLRFIRRAFVGTLEEEELRSFGGPSEQDLLEEGLQDSHDGEL